MPLVNCETCDRAYSIIPSRVGRTRYCTRICKEKAGRIDLTCSTCGGIFVRKKTLTRKRSKSGHVFCSTPCRAKAQRIGGLSGVVPAHYGTTERRYRMMALRVHGSACSSCQYDNEVKMLDVHHKDGDRANNTIGNLEILCVWCHAMLTRNVQLHKRQEFQRNEPKSYSKLRPIIKLMTTRQMNPTQVSRALGVPHATVFNLINKARINYRAVLRGDLTTVPDLIKDS